MDVADKRLQALMESTASSFAAAPDSVENFLPPLNADGSPKLGLKTMSSGFEGGETGNPFKSMMKEDTP